MSHTKKLITKFNKKGYKAAIIKVEYDGEDPTSEVQIELAGSTVPTQGTTEAAGYDIRANKKIVIPKHSDKLVSTRIKIKLPVCHKFS